MTFNFSSVMRPLSKPVDIALPVKRPNMAFRVRFLAFYCTLKSGAKNTQTFCLRGSEGEPALGFEPRTYGLQNRCDTR